MQNLLDVKMWHWHHHPLPTHRLHCRSTNHYHTCMLKPSSLDMFNWDFLFWILTSWKTNLFWSDFEVFLVIRLFFEGKNWWWLLVPLKVLAPANRDSRHSVWVTMSNFTKKEVTLLMFDFENSNSCFGVRILSENVRWRLAWQLTS